MNNPLRSAFTGHVSQHRNLIGCSETSLGPIYKISYDLSYAYVKFIVISTYDGDFQRAKISFRNIVSQFTNTISDHLTIVQVNRT